jgi:signal transduction histidine kinase
MVVTGLGGPARVAARALGRPAWWWAEVRPSLTRRRVGLIWRVFAVTALCAVADLPLWRHHPLLPAVNLPVTAGFTLTGLLLRDEPGQRATSWALILAGVTRPLGWLNDWGVGPFALYSVVFGYLDNLFGAWALLRYPHHRMARRHRVFLLTASGWLIAGPFVLCLLSTPADHGFSRTAWWPALWPRPHLFTAAQTVVDVGAIVIAVVFLVLLTERGLEGDRRDRAVIQPVVFAGVLAAVAAAATMAYLTFDGPNDEVFSIEAVAELAVPVAFMVSISQQRLIRMATMVTELRETVPTGELLRQVLRIHLRDADLELLVWSREQDTYLTPEGHAAPPAADGRPNHVVTGRDGGPLAMLVPGPAGVREPELLTTAVALTRLALANSQLSRRLVTTEYLARQEVAADLHDGAQAELCGLRVVLASAARTADPDTLERLEEARRQVDAALRDLRNLSHGIYPHTLARFGLRAALEETAARLDLPAAISTPDEPLHPAVEKTVYFLICEALTNAAKHAAPTMVDVAIVREPTGILATVTDDGRGGADPAGTGLARLGDRVQALGGGLTVTSVPGAGTRLEARIPCA